MPILEYTSQGTVVKLINKLGVQLFFGVLLLYIFLSFSANAYVRSQTSSCKPLYWNQTCVYVQADSTYVQDMIPADIEQAIQNAINSWQTKISPDSFLQIKYLPADGVKETTYQDGLQVIKFRSDKWCRGATDMMPEICYDPAATAITTVTYVNQVGDPSEGKILDADIELNAVHYFFFNADSGKPLQNPSDLRKPVDLWNTLTHEMGHMQGLEHPCKSASEPASMCLVDEKGMQRPYCVAVVSQRTTNSHYDEIYHATMFPNAEPQETSKRIPQKDDVQAILDSYPVQSDPQVCMQPGVPEEKGCRAVRAETKGLSPFRMLLFFSILGVGVLFFSHRFRRDPI